MDRLIGNPHTGSQFMVAVLGWTDPIRVIGTSPGQPKQVVALVEHAGGDRSKVADRPLWLAAVVVPQVRSSPSGVACVDLDEASGEAAVRAEMLPQRVRWLGLEPDPRPLSGPPTAPRYLRISYAYQDASLAATALRDALRGAR
jgi:hypothetical protein